MEARRRQPSASTSTSHSTEDVPKVRDSTRRGSTGTAPPGDDGDETTPRRSSQGRSTRNRNPLPPTSGPLFPPLPPKAPKNSPKNSPQTSRSTPQARTPLASNPIQPTDRPETKIIQGELLSLQADADVNGGGDTSRHSSPSGSTTKQGQLSVSGVSGTSLTPPPPTSEDAGVDLSMDVDPPELEGEGEGDIENDGGESSGVPENGSEDWSAYQQHRRVRGFAEVKNGVKIEPEDAVDEEETPKRNGSSRPNGQKGEVTTAGSPPSHAGRETSAARARRRRGEEQLLLDDHLLPEEMRKTGSITGKRGKGAVKDEDEDDGNKAAEDAPDEEEEEEEDDEEREDVTRCVCKTEDTDVMMIQCDKCNVWQHGPCVGIWLDDEAPDEYFCEECRPDLHGPLRKWNRARGRNAPFIPPQPADLLKFHNASDKYPPSQSKRWPQNQVQELPKAPSRSHHRKESGSPVATTDSRDRDGRRSQRGRLPPSSVSRDKPVSTGKDRRKEPPTGGRRNVSITSPSPSTSPPPSHPPKRRSTMNSRDAAYEEQVRAALEASRKDSVPLELDEEVEEKDEEEKQADEVVVTDDKVQARKGKRKRDEDETGSDGGNTPVPSGINAKPKHPNQYTYRPKPPSQTQAVASPIRRVGQASTPIPSLPPPAQHEHGTRRAGAIANGIIPPPPNSISVHNLHWHLPDHLSAFSDLLPSQQPVALESRAPRQLTYLPRNHFHNQKYGPFSEDRDENGKLVLPDEPSPRDPIGEPVTQLEPPARVRYPVKRITTGEMRKRVRNVLEYVGRVQAEETKRKERAKLVGIDPEHMTPAKRVNSERESEEGAVEGEDGGGEGEVDGSADSRESRQPTVFVGQGPTSVELMDDLMRDLIAFQETFNAAAGFVSPMPPAISTFAPNAFPSSAPVTPIPPSTATIGGEPEADAADPPTTTGAEDIVLDAVEGQDAERHEANAALPESEPNELDKSNAVTDEEAPGLVNQEVPTAEPDQSLPVLSTDVGQDEGAAATLPPVDDQTVEVPVEKAERLDGGEGTEDIQVDTLDQVDQITADHSTGVLA